MTEPAFSLVRYRDALLIQTRTRKPTTCVQCRDPIAVGEWAWRTLTENIHRGVLRSQRWHARRFTGGVYPRRPVACWSPSGGALPRRSPAASGMKRRCAGSSWPARGLAMRRPWPRSGRTTDSESSGRQGQDEGARRQPGGPDAPLGPATAPQGAFVGDRWLPTLPYRRAPDWRGAWAPALRRQVGALVRAVRGDQGPGCRLADIRPSPEDLTSLPEIP